MNDFREPLATDEAIKVYQKRTVIVQNKGRARFIRYVLNAMSLLFFIGGVAIAWVAMGLIEDGQLAPLWQRASIAGGMLLVSLLIVWDFALYLGVYITELSVLAEPKDQELRQAIVLLQTMTLTGFKERAVAINSLERLRYNDGGNWANGIGQDIQVNAPYYLFNIQEQSLPFIIDGKSNHFDSAAIAQLF